MSETNVSEKSNPRLLHGQPLGGTRGMREGRNKWAELGGGLMS